MYNATRPASLIPQGQAFLENWEPHYGPVGNYHPLPLHHGWLGAREETVDHLSGAQIRSRWLHQHSAAETRGPSQAATAPAPRDHRKVKEQETLLYYYKEIRQL